MGRYSPAGPLQLLSAPSPLLHPDRVRHLHREQKRQAFCWSHSFERGGFTILTNICLHRLASTQAIPLDACAQLRDRHGADSKACLAPTVQTFPILLMGFRTQETLGMCTDSVRGMIDAPLVRHSKNTSRPEACSAVMVDEKKITSSSGWAVTNRTLPGLLIGDSARRPTDPDSSSRRPPTQRASKLANSNLLLFAPLSWHACLHLNSRPVLARHALSCVSACFIVSGRNICSVKLPASRWLLSCVAAESYLRSQLASIRYP